MFVYRASCVAESPMHGVELLDARLRADFAKPEIFMRRDITRNHDAEIVEPTMIRFVDD